MGQAGRDIAVHFSFGKSSNLSRMDYPANSNCWSSLAVPGGNLCSLLDTCSEEGPFAVDPGWRTDTDLWGEVLFGLAIFKHTQLEGGVGL